MTTPNREQTKRETIVAIFYYIVQSVKVVWIATIILSLIMMFIEP